MNRRFRPWRSWRITDQPDCANLGGGDQAVDPTPNPQQMLPTSKVAVESQALRDLKASDNLAFDGLVALASSLADQPVVFPRLQEVRNKLVCLARF
jgi:hypothetical protein